jgi:ABC-type bacteriocin/lantibiotic exporter with double-glycine peptidase domain
MVLAHLGQELPEMTLRDLCECDDEGTFQSKAVECAKHYGFLDSYWAYIGFDDLEASLKRGLYSVVYLELSSSYGLNKHAVVVTGIDADVVEVLDPHPVFGGERSMEKSQFIQGWLAMNGLTILIQ